MHLDATGARIDRDMGGVGAVAVGALGAAVAALGDEAVGGEVGEGHRTFSRGHGLAVREDDIGRGTAEPACRRLAHRGAQLGGGIEDRRAAHHHRARRIAAEAFAHAVGRAVIDAADAIRRHLQRIGGDLGEHRLETLAVRRRADMDRHRAIGLEHQAGGFPRARRAALEIAADGETMVAAGGERSLQRRLHGPADLLEAARECRAVVAAVGLGRKIELDDARQRIGHLAFRDQVAAAKLDGIDTEIARGHVEQPLAEEIRLEPPRSAIGADRRLAGQHERDLHVDVRHAIGTRENLRGVARACRAVGADIGADVGPGVAAQPADGAVAVAGDLELAGDVAGMVGGEEMLAAVLDPLDRAPDRARSKGNEEIFRIELAAHAESAADVVLDHADRALCHAELLCEDAPVGKRHLGGAMDSEPAVAPFGEDAAQLHRHRGVALDLERLAPHIGRVAKGGIGIALHRSQGAGEIGGALLEQQCAVLRG